MLLRVLMVAGLLLATAAPATWDACMAAAKEAEKAGNRQEAIALVQAAIPFLFSDSPEYLYHDSVGKGLARMTLPGATPFGVGWNHINKTANAQPLRLLVRA